MPRARPTAPWLKTNSAGVYEIHHWRDDTRIRLSTGTSDPIRAQQELADYESALIGPRPAVYTVKDALADYLSDRRGRGKDDSGRDIISSLDRIETASIPINSFLGALRLDQIDQARWNAYAAQRKTKATYKQRTPHVPRPVSTGTLRREFVVLRAALNLAIRNRHLDRLPIIEPPKESASRTSWLTPEECKAVITTAQGHVKTFVAIALTTGARKSAILDLTWDRVFLDVRSIDFQPEGRAKTKKRRAIVPINNQLLGILKTARSEAHAECPYVVQFRGSAVPTGLKMSFTRLCERAGLTWRPTPHVLKHTAASILAMRHIPIDDASRLLATDRKTLEKIYTHFDPLSLLRTASDALTY